MSLCHGRGGLRAATHAVGWKCKRRLPRPLTHRRHGRSAHTPAECDPFVCNQNTSSAHAGSRMSSIPSSRKATTATTATADQTSKSQAVAQATQAQAETTTPCRPKFTNGSHTLTRHLIADADCDSEESDSEGCETNERRGLKCK